MSIRPVTEEELSKVFEIEKAGHVAPWGEENLRSELEKPYSHFLVMTDDETDEIIMGYIVYWLMYDECHILNVVVHPDFRRRGIAKALVREAVKAALRKGVKQVMLEVRKSNLAAIELYQGLQFSILHIRKNFYSDGEDAYQMGLFLNEEKLPF